MTRSDDSRGSITRRSVIEAVGGATGAAALVPQSAETADGTMLSELHVTEATVQYKTDREITGLHVDPLSAYGINNETATMGIYNLSPELRETLKSGDPIAIGAGIEPLPRTINRGDVTELPLAADGLTANEFLPLRSAVSMPAIILRQTKNTGLQVKTGGKTAQVNPGEAVTLELSPKGVGVSNGDQARVTPRVTAVNHGHLTVIERTE